MSGFGGIRRNRRLLVLAAIPALLSCSAQNSGDAHPDQPAAKTRATPAPARDVRPEALADRFYPGNAAELKRQVREYLSVARLDEEPDADRIRGVIAPHAGYQFSGAVAGWAYAGIKPGDYDRVLLLAPSHAGRFSGASVTPYTHYRTPLGEYPVDVEAVAALDGPLFSTQRQAEDAEHSIEVHLPFLQAVLPDAVFVPVMIGFAASYDNLVKIAEALARIVDHRTLIVASSDFTHYGPNFGYVPFTDDVPARIEALDYGALELIADMKSRALYDYKIETGATICGCWPIIVAMEIINQKYADPRGRVVEYDTSGRILNDYRNSVSYASVIWRGGEPAAGESAGAETGRADRLFLLQLARTTIKNSLAGEPAPEVDESGLSDLLMSRKGCFVTLKTQGRLRGCMGSIIGTEPLYKCVISNAVNSAFHDPRFPRLGGPELAEVEIEVSILTEPEPLGVSGAEAVLAAVRPHVDGVLLERGAKRSVYLPQVWEQIPGKRRFLGELCAKAGMSSDCWHDPDTIIHTYQAEHFSENEM